MSQENYGGSISTCLRHQRGFSDQKVPQIAYRHYWLKCKNKTHTYHNRNRYVTSTHASNSWYASTNTSSNLAISVTSASAWGSTNGAVLTPDWSVTPQWCSRLSSRQCVYCSLTPVSPLAWEGNTYRCKKEVTQHTHHLPWLLYIRYCQVGVEIERKHRYMEVSLFLTSFILGFFIGSEETTVTHQVI